MKRAVMLAAGRLREARNVGARPPRRWVHAVAAAPLAVAAIDDGDVATALRAPPAQRFEAWAGVAVAGLPTPAEAGHPLTPDTIAARQGVPIEAASAQVEAALAALRPRTGRPGEGDGLRGRAMRRPHDSVERRCRPR